MTSEAIFEQHLRKAAVYENEAVWELARIELLAAERLCGDLNHVVGKRRKRKVLNALGGNERRHARYDEAVKLLKAAIDVYDEEDLEHADISGELGVVYLQMNDPEKAQESFQRQYDIARKLTTATQDMEETVVPFPDRTAAQTHALLAKAQHCRAAGNLGSAIWQQVTRDDYYPLYEGEVKALQEIAIKRVEQRIELAKDLQNELGDSPEINLMRSRAMRWHSIGLDRLTVFYTYMGDFEKALESGRKSNAVTESTTEPTVSALSLFYHGYALAASGAVTEAKILWEKCRNRDKCTPVIALAKEPSRENCRYMELLVQHKVSFSQVDGQGYGPLDYAVFSEDNEMELIVLDGLRQDLRAQHSNEVDYRTIVEREIKGRHYEARRRKHYKQIFQRSFYPILATTEENPTHLLREAYSRSLEPAIANDAPNEKREFFDNSRYLAYEEFLNLRKLPVPGVHDQDNKVDKLVYDYLHEDSGLGSSAKQPFVIFLSYRWLRKDSPDDEKGTQYGRMKDALTLFLASHQPRLESSQVKVWIVSRCPCRHRWAHILIIKLTHRMSHASTKSILYVVDDSAVSTLFP